MDFDSSLQAVINSFDDYIYIAPLKEEELALMKEISHIQDEIIANLDQTIHGISVGFWNHPKDVLEQRFSELTKQRETLDDKLFSLRKRIARLRMLRKLKIAALLVTSLLVSSFAVKQYVVKFRNSGVFLNLFNIKFE